MANKLLSDLFFAVAGEVADAFDRSSTPGPSAPRDVPPKPSRFAGEDQKDGSPAVLTRGALTGYAHSTAEGPWSLVVTGMLNKQIAAALGIGEKTVKVHRARVMEKMEAASVADLVRLADRAGVIVPKSEMR